MTTGTIMRRRGSRMRSKMTASEHKAATLLRALDIPFKAQVVCGRYIADFVGLDRNFVLEIDGPSHVLQAEYDNERNAFFQAAGFRVIRIFNHEVSRAVLDERLGDCQPWTKREADSRIWLASLLLMYWHYTKPVDALARLHCGVSESRAD